MPDGFPQVVICSRLGFAQQGFEFGERLLDWVQVGGVAGQEQHPRPARFDCLSGSRTFVDIEIVPYDDIAGLEDGGELGFDIGIEGLAIHGPFDHPGRHQFVAAQGGDEGLRVPLAEGGFGDQPLPLLASPAKRCHVGLDAGLVDEQQPCGSGLYGRQAVPMPLIALRLDVVAFPLRRQQRFFYS